MSWLATLPLIGDLFKSVETVVSQFVVDKDKANELSVKLNEMFKDAVEKYYDFVIKTEGELKDLATFGFAGKILAFMRVGWRPVLQWGLVTDVIINRIMLGTPFMQMQEEIMFISGLAVLRGLEKKLPWGNGKNGR